VPVLGYFPRGFCYPVRLLVRPLHYIGASLRIPPTEDVADRLALFSNDFQKLFAIAVAFVVYHSCRNSDSPNRETKASVQAAVAWLQ